MAAKLVLCDDYHGFYAAWFEDDEEGARVGDGLVRKDDKYLISKSTEKVADPEYVAAEREAAAFANENPDYVRLHQGALYIEVRAKAMSFMRRLRLAMKIANENSPWPDWAIKAKQEGWKPPRNWKP